MDQKQIEENNILIAEFMGYKILSSSKEDFLIRYKNEENRGEWKTNGKNKYNTDWNWLMEVCIKISNLKDFPRPVLNGINSVTPYINAMRKMKKGVINFDIIETHLGVISFIKWYNENKKE